MKPLIRMLRKETGQALPMALVLLVVGVMVTTIILDLTTTNLKATQVIDQKTRNIYAADAGIDDGLWKVRYNYLPASMLGEWEETTYTQDPYSYVMHDSDDPENTVPINDREVDVAIKPIWLLEGLEEIPAQQGRTSDDRLLTYGNIIGDGIYEVSILHDGSLDPLQIQRIGCWLPPGFEYVDGSSNLEQGSGQPYYCIPDISNHNGGIAITWDYAGIDYDELPAQGSRRIVTFEFTPNEETTDVFCWTRTSRDDVRLSWDTAKRIFEITSTAPNDSEKQTTIVSHSVKKEFQALGGAINGDYQATGIGLMRDTSSGWGRDYKRDRLYKETWTNIPPTTNPPTDPIPDGATVEKIFLYWSGWKCLPWNPTEAELNGLPVNKHVNEVALKVKVGGVEMGRTKVTAADTQVMRNTLSGDPNGWSYSCFADITSTVTDYFKGQGVSFYGNATYTVGHWDIQTTKINETYRYQLCNWKEPHNNECTAPPTIYYARYPLGSPRSGGSYWVSWPRPGHWEDYIYEDENSSQDYLAYAGWSVIVIYSSPATAGHHLYLYDEFQHCDQRHSIPYTIRGFLAPQDVLGDPNAARLTCFVGEGDEEWDDGDNLFLNNHRLNPSPEENPIINPVDNVWNGHSNVIGGADTDNGVDIDTFTAGGGTIIIPGDTEAYLDMPTGTDIWNLVYIMLSFRSEITTGGVIDYSIK